MADEKTFSEHGLDEPVPGAAGNTPVDPSLGSSAPDMVVLQDLGAESAGDPGSDESPRDQPTESAAGGIINSGPTEPGFKGTEEYTSCAQASQTPGRDAESGVPPQEADATAPGDNLRQ